MNRDILDYIKHNNQYIMGFSGKEGRKHRKNIDEFMVKHFPNLILFNFRHNKQKDIHC